MRFIRDNGATLLFYISRPALRSEYQICSFTLHCTQNTNLDSENEIPMPMRKLEAELRIHFAHDLRFSEGKPKLALRRNIVHRDLHLEQNSLNATTLKGQLIEGTIALQDNQTKALLGAPSKHQTDTHYYAISTNTKSRVIYIDFFPLHTAGFRHCVAISASRHVYEVVDALSGLGNILRSQIKPGLPWSPGRGMPNEPARTSPDPMTINVLFSRPLKDEAFTLLILDPKMKSLAESGLLVNWRPEIRDPEIDR